MTHPTEPLVHPVSGESVDIDLLLVPVIRATWALGIDTLDSCQNLGEVLAQRFADVPAKKPYVRARQGRAQIAFETPRDAETFMNAIVFAGTRDEEFHFRATHWAAPNCWEWSTSMLDAGMIEAAQDDVPDEDLADPTVVLPEFTMLWPQVLLPATDLSEVLRRLLKVAESG